MVDCDVCVTVVGIVVVLVVLGRSTVVEPVVVVSSGLTVVEAVVAVISVVEMGDVAVVLSDFVVVDVPVLSSVDVSCVVDAELVDPVVVDSDVKDTFASVESVNVDVVEICWVVSRSCNVVDATMLEDDVPPVVVLTVADSVVV